MAVDQPLKQKESYPINELGSFSLSDTRPRFFQEASGKPVEQLSTIDTLKLRLKCQKLIAEFKNHDHFVKTHSRYGTFKGHSLINDRVSKGAIYLVRNPLDLVISYAAHLGARCPRPESSHHAVNAATKRTSSIHSMRGE